MKKHINVITGITSQSGIYLSKALIQHGDKVLGTTTNISNQRLNLVDSVVKIIHFDYCNTVKLHSYLDGYDSICIFNLAAQSSVRYSWENENETFETNYKLVIKLIDLMKTFTKTKDIKLIQIGSSEMFGDNSNLPWSETTSFEPKSPYAESKVLAYDYCDASKIDSKLWIANAIVFNHESRFRKNNMLTKQIASQVLEIKSGIRKNIEVDDLYISRDWMHTSDTVNALIEISHLETPQNFIVSSGKETTLLELINIFLLNSLQHTDIEILSKKTNLATSYYAKRVLGDNSKLLKATPWSQKTSLEEMVKDIQLGYDQ